MAKETMSKLGIWAFIIGLVLAIVIALVSGSTPQTWGFVTLAILGVIVGVLNISDKEMQTFLLATVAFIIGLQTLGGVVDKLFLGWKAVGTFFNLVSVFMAAAAVVVSIMALYKLARD